MRTIVKLLPVLVPAILLAREPVPLPLQPDLVIREVRYDGALTDKEARFVVEVDAESLARGEACAPLFEGDVAAFPHAKMPANLRLGRVGNQYQLIAARPGRYKLQLDLVAKITRAEPWNHVAFIGPAAAIASVAAQAAGEDVELQLLGGTPTETPRKGEARVRGFLGADRTVSLRWQSRKAEAVRRALATCETAATLSVSPAAIRFTTHLRYDIVQGSLPRLTVTLPAAQALTRLQGEQIRDWQLKTEGGRQLLTVELIKPLEKNYSLTLFTEQPVETTSATVQLAPPQPQDIARETGTLTLSAEDMVVETGAATGLRQINAPGGALAAWQFYGRPVTLALKLKRIEPVVNAATRVTLRQEESRLLATHALTLNVEKASVYSVELAPLGAFLVSDVRGEGIEDWKAAGGRLVVTFSSRVLGQRAVEVQLEQTHKTAPEQITLAPLRVAGAAKETAEIGAAAAPGFRIKTAKLTGLREIPVASLSIPDPRSAIRDFSLAFTSEQADWQLTLAVERLAARLLADIFNLVTIGDGLVGGSATIRYAVLHQGVQEFRLRLPPHWKNIEFTGPGIRRKDQQKDPKGDTWTIGLQEKAWGGYTLVITYDEQFDPHRATLAIGGVHALDVERETGTLAITSAANLQLREKNVGGASAPRPTATPDSTTSRGAEAPPTLLQRIDESELASSDRALISRPVLLAYRYAGGAGATPAYDLRVDVTRFEEQAVLQAVADRTQLTTVLTDAGQMLTQASFMVKNNDKQFQRFTLPKGAEFWSCFVDNQPAKPERDGDALLVPLPRREDRDRAFAVDIVYAQKTGDLKSWTPRALAVSAPRTDVQTTYAEWELYVPQTHTLTRFGGNMTVARGTTYGLSDAWRAFIGFYDDLFREGTVAILGVMVFLFFAALLIAGIRRGWRGALVVLGVSFVLFLLAGLFMPTVSRMKERGSRMRAAAGPPAEALSRVATEPSTRALAAKPQMPAALRPAGRLALPAAPGPVPVDESVMANIRLGVVAGGAGERLAERGAMGSATASPLITMPAPAVAGIRPIRVEIPRTGQRFVFTKVLNVRDETLSAEAWAMKTELRNAARGAAQLVAILAGLLLFRWQLRRARPSSFWAAIGLALMAASIGSFLITVRMLHAVFILAVPVLAVVVLVWPAKRFFPRNKPPVPPAVPRVVAPLIALAFFAAVATAQDQAQQAVQHSVTPPLHHSIPASPGVTISSATYTGAVRGKVAQFEAVVEFTTAQPGARVPLLGEDVALQEFTATSKEARLLRDGHAVSVMLPKAGSATARLKFLAKVAGEAASRQIAFAMPPALSSRLTVTLDEPDAVVELPTAVSFTTTAEQQQTRVEAVIGAAGRVDLAWTPRVKRAAEVAASAFCQNLSFVAFGNGVMQTRAKLGLQVAQGELRQARVRLPAGHRLLRVEGDSVRTWNVNDDAGAQVLTVELLKAVSSTNWPLTVVTEKVLGKLPALERVELPRALDVKRETGMVALSGSEELSVAVETARDVLRVEAEEFLKSDARRWRPEDEGWGFAKAGKAVAKAAPPAPPAIQAAYRFQKPEFELTARVEAVQPQIEAVVQNKTMVTAEQTSLSAQVDYTIKKTGVFALRLALPAGHRIESVAGEKISQWVEKTEAGARVLEVTLKDRTVGAYALRLELVRPQRDLPKSVEIAGVHPLGAQKLSGTVSVTGEMGIQLKTESLEGLTEIPAAPAADQASGSALAYKFIVSEPVPSAPWKLAVSTEAVEPWVRAEVVNHVTITETLVTGRSLARYEIQNAPVKELRVRVPAAFKNVELHGVDIRRRDQTRGEWRVELQNKTRGFYFLTVTWELPWTVKQGALEMTGVEAVGVERESGGFAVAAKPPLQVEGLPGTGDLLRVDGRELPDWAGRAPEATVLAYRYLRPGWKAKLTVKRFEEAGVLQALVDSAQLRTQVAEDGQMMTQMTLAVRNNGRQCLEVTLPPGAEVWSAFVGGQAVRPSRRDGKLLLPLERAGSDDTPVQVELTYVSHEKFPKRRGEVALVSPAVDVPLKNARWELYLPPDYGYGGFDGSMAHEAETSPLVQVFTLGEYERVESEQEQAREAKTFGYLSSVRSNLQQGKAKEAMVAYNAARGSGMLGRKDAADFKQVEDELRRAQASNVAGGNAFSFAGGGAPVQSPRQAAGTDADVAGRQFDKLQQAQELAVARVLPLRVALPTHGVRHAFTQALQTEIGQPLTVKFTAANARDLGWAVWLGLGLGGFALLWLASAALARRKAATAASASAAG